MNILNAELVHLDNEFTTKEEILSHMVDKTFSCGFISDTNEVMKSILNREELASTEVGMSIAMPHGRNDKILKPSVSFARMKKPIKWDEEYVDLIFLILVPQDKAEKLHLKYISELSKKLLDDSFRTELYNLKTLEDLKKIEL